MLTCQLQYRLFELSHRNSEVDPFTGETTVWIHPSASTPPGPSMPVRPRLRSQLPPSSPMKKETPADRSPNSPSMSQPPLQADQNEAMKPSPTVRETMRPLQKEANCSFIKPVSLMSFHQMCIPVCNLFSSISKLCYVLGGDRAANRGQTSVAELLHSITGFGCHTREGVRNSRQGLWIHPKFVV